MPLDTKRVRQYDELAVAADLNSVVADALPVVITKLPTNSSRREPSFNIQLHEKINDL